MSNLDTLLASLTRRPLVVVRGKVQHYHEIELTEEEPDPGDPDWPSHPMYRPVFRVTFPFHLTLRTYHAPAVRESSIWIVRRWRAESFSLETYSGARLKPSRKRSRLIFLNAVEDYPAVETEIRRRTPSDLRPGGE